jgi:hypothetical protein
MVPTLQIETVENFGRQLLKGSSLARPWIGSIGSGELAHYTMIFYPIPSQRIARILPPGYETDDLQIAGEKVSLLTISSFLDMGTKQNPRPAFEQTDYRLHVKHNGSAANYLLGSSLGSLSAIATRQLWQMPWHLGAMEFQINYNAEEDRYTDYRLSTQSQWANAYWEIADQGVGVKNDLDSAILSLVAQAEATDHFLRRDGSMGSRKLRFLPQHVTRGALLNARCDFLQKMNLLSAHEILQPLQVSIFRKVFCRFEMPQMEGATNLTRVSQSKSGSQKKKCGLSLAH